MTSDSSNDLGAKKHFLFFRDQSIPPLFVFLSGHGFGGQIRNPRTKTGARNRVTQVLQTNKKHCCPFILGRAGAFSRSIGPSPSSARCACYGVLASRTQNRSAKVGCFLGLNWKSLSLRIIAHSITKSIQKWASSTIRFPSTSESSRCSL